MGKGNKVRKREVKKPKQDKKAKGLTSGSVSARTFNMTPPPAPRVQAPRPATSTTTSAATGAAASAPVPPPAGR